MKPGLPVLTNDTIVVRRNELPAARLAETVLAVMNAERNHYFGMEDAAARIWELLETPVSIGSLCMRLVEEYDIDQMRCRNEVMHFLADAAGENLIRVECA